MIWLSDLSLTPVDPVGQSVKNPHQLTTELHHDINYEIQSHSKEYLEVMVTEEISNESTNRLLRATHHIAEQISVISQRYLTVYYVNPRFYGTDD